MDRDTKWRLRVMDPGELDALYKNHMEKDFPSAERPNLKAMRRHVREGLQEVLLLSGGKADAGYSVLAEANGVMLITLLAIFPQKRGQGLGTILLTLLQARYKAKRAILLEVEDPAMAEGAADKKIREKRVAFYERSGYMLIDEVEHTSFGVPLLLMALPLADTMERVRAGVVHDVQAAYARVLPETLLPRVVTRSREIKS